MNAAVDNGMVPRIRSAIFEIASTQPEQAPRWVLWVICTLFVVLLVWVTFAKLDIVTVAQGRLVPQTYVKIVQPAQSGIVRDILVNEGDTVDEGQVLVRLDPTESMADDTATRRELAIQRLQMRRIDAELSGTAMASQPNDDSSLFAQAQAQYLAHRQQYLDAVAQEKAAGERAAKELQAATEVQIKLERTLPSYLRTADSYEKLAKQQLVGALQADEKRREATEVAQDLESQRASVQSLRAAAGQSVSRLAQLKSAYESELHTSRVAATERITQLEQDSAKIRYRQTQLELRAPQKGIVKELATSTIGAVVQPGTVLVSLVPANEPFLAEVAIDNQDIGFVRSGQAVRIKLATFPFQKYGMLEGRVKTVIADSREAAQDRSDVAVNKGATTSFKAVIELRQQMLVRNGARWSLGAGMQLDAEILEGKRTVLEYLLSPVQRIANESGRER